MNVAVAALAGLLAAASPGPNPAEAAFQAGNWETSERLFREATINDPHDRASWQKLGLSLHNLARFEEAIAAFERAGKEGAPAPFVAMRKVRAYSRLGQLDRAFAGLEEALMSGFANAALLRTDPDFESLRKDARFAEMSKRVELAQFPCKGSSEARQFDFWIGDWDVEANGVHAGDSRVEKILGDCVLLENWEGTGSVGKSFNVFDPVTHSWRQTWVDSQQSIVDYRGSLQDGAMRFEATSVDPKGAKTHYRMTFTPQGKDQVRQFIEQSTDGKTWSVNFDGLYRRKKA